RGARREPQARRLSARRAARNGARPGRPAAALSRRRPGRRNRLPFRRGAVLADGRRGRPDADRNRPQSMAHRARRRGPHAAGRLPEGATLEQAIQLRGVLESVRQGYLDALPIAAAILTLSDDPYVECANEQFRFLAEWDERLGERRVTEIPMLRVGPIGTRLVAFIAGDDPAF